MGRFHRDDILFSCLGLLVFLVLAGACAAVRWYMAWWYIEHCGQGPGCAAASAATDYWWVVLLALALAAAWPINRAYQARLGRREQPSD